MHQCLQIGDRRTGIAHVDVRDILAVALLHRQACAILDEAGVVVADDSRVPDQRTQPLAGQLITKRILVMDAPDLFRAIARLRDAIGENGVIDQELNGIDAVGRRHPTRHIPEKTRHAQRIVAGGGHGADADPVGFELVRPRVVDLMLDGGALSGHDRPFHGVGRPVPGGCAQ